MGKERYLPVLCPAPDGEGVCGAFVTKIEISHHSLTGQVCPKCGTLWRVFHNSDDPNVELSFFERLEDTAMLPVLEISWGRIKKPEPETIHG
jgi:hypothetical protein